MTTKTRFSGYAAVAETEAAKSNRTRRWVREYEAAMENIGSGWGVDEHGQPFLVNMIVDGKMRKSRKPTGVKKASAPKPALPGASHAMSGKAKAS